MRKKKKGKRVLAFLLTVFGLITGIGSFREPVQAAENITGIDFQTAQNLWNVTLSWNDINENANLTSVEAGGFTQKVDTGTLIYMEAPGILGYPDTTSWIRATYDNIGAIGGRSVSVQVTFRSFYGKKDTIAMGTEDGCHLSIYNDIRYIADMEKSGVALNKCFWHGFTQHDIYAMGEEYHLYFTDTGEGISCKGAYLTANSLNEGEGIRYNTEGQDGGNLNTFLRTDHQLTNGEYGFWYGNSNNFPDDPRAADYTKNSVCFQLCTDDPKFFMSSEGCDYWHTFNVSPLGATIPEEPNKVGVTSAGVQVDKFQNAKVGDTLMFDVSQKVEYLTVTGAVRYQSFQIIDTLPQELTYVDANVTDENGNLLNASQVSITTNAYGQVIATFSDDYLKNGMRYAGETYHLHVAARVNQQAAQNTKFINQGYTIINNTMSTVKKVDIEVIQDVPDIQPALSIEKTVPKYEYQVGDTIEYTIKVNQTVNGATARDLVISDTSLPEGLAVSEDADAIAVDYPKTWTDKGGAVHQTSMTAARKGNGFTVMMDGLNYNAPVTIKVKCKAQEAANGQKIKNTATAQADNVDATVQASASVYINSPKLSINKEVSKYEWQVGDTVDYTIKVNQTVNGCLARNVRISDTSLPEGLAVSEEADAVTVDYPKTWTDTDGSTHQTAASTARQGTGFTVSLDGLNGNAPVTIKVKCKAKESVNGQKITNTAMAQADNVKAAVKDNASVYINSPKLSINKEVSKYEWQVGDTVDYTIKVNQTVNGCLARNVRISDTSLPEGLAVSEEADAVTVDYPKTWTDTDGSSHQTAVSTVRQGTGFEVTLDGLKENAPVTIKVKCKAKESVNGQKITNTATAQADNVKAAVKDNARVYINSPELSIDKEVSKYEWRVGDTVDYTIKVNQTVNGCLAKNIRISDTSLPEGLAVSQDADAVTVDYPKIWTEPESGAVRQTAVSTVRQGNGFVVTLDRLEHAPVTVKVKCTVTETVNGNVVVNTATAQADNVKTSVKDNAEVYINSPGVHIEKECDRNYAKVGDLISYTLHVDNWTAGSLARNVVIADQIETDGMKLQKNSIVLLDSDGNPIEDAKITVKGNTFSIETGRTLICPEANYQIIDADKGNSDGGKLNPEGAAKEEAFTVEYQVTATKQVEEGGVLQNKATVTCDEGTKDEDEAVVRVNGPMLDMVKSSDKSTYQVGETGHYTLTIRETRESLTAKAVTVTDTFAEKGMTIDADSISAEINGEAFEPESVEVNENGFTIKTGKDLTDTDKLVIYYDVLFDTVTPGEYYTNNAVAKGSNTEEAKDKNKVLADEGEAPELIIDKKAEKEQAKVGETNNYTVKVTQESHYVTAKNVVIQDSFDKDGAVYVKDSLKIIDKKGQDITKEVKISYADKGFIIKTGRDLGYNEYFKVTYSLSYADASLGGQTIMNTAVASSDNTEEVSAASQVEIKPDAPELSVVKKAAKSKVHVGESNTYTVTVKETKEGETAKDVVIRDCLSDDGAEYVQSSLKVTDQDGKEVAGIMTVFEKNGFTIQTGRDLSYNQSLIVTYDVVYHTVPAKEGNITNTAVVKGQNTGDVPGGNVVIVLPNTPELLIAKKAENTKVKAGETNTYTVTVNETKEGETAKNVIIKDFFDKEGTSYIQDSLKVTDQDGKEITGTKVTFSDNGFVINTGKDLKYNEALNVTYQVKYAETLAGNNITNTAVAKADDADEVNIPCTVNILQESPELSIKKEAEKSEPKVGETNTYTVTVKETKEGETAKNVVIKDSFDKEGASYVQNSLKVTDQDGKEITGTEVTFSENGFVIKTGKNLKYNEAFIVTYQAVYTDTLAGKDVTNTATAKADDGDEVKVEKAVKVKKVTTVKKKVVSSTTTPKKTETQKVTTKTTKAPQTGLHDHFWLFAILGVVLLSGGVAGIIYLVRKRRK